MPQNAVNSWTIHSPKYLWPKYGINKKWKKKCFAGKYCSRLPDSNTEFTLGKVSFRHHPWIKFLFFFGKVVRDMKWLIMSIMLSNFDFMFLFWFTCHKYKKRYSLLSQRFIFWELLHKNTNCLANISLVLSNTCDSTV